MPQLCPKAVFHVDLDAWRHQSLVIRMFHPMLAYQTFESTSLTDVVKKRKGRLVDRLKTLKPIKRLEEWAVDPVTLQVASPPTAVKPHSRKYHYHSHYKSC